MFRAERGKIGPTCDDFGAKEGPHPSGHEQKARKNLSISGRRRASLAAGNAGGGGDD
jgi:hypothetical protein